jgi:hypothetical protein
MGKPSKIGSQFIRDDLGCTTMDVFVCVAVVQHGWTYKNLMDDLEWQMTYNGAGRGLAKDLRGRVEATVGATIKKFVTGQLSSFVVNKVKGAITKPSPGTVPSAYSVAKACVGAYGNLATWAIWESHKGANMNPFDVITDNNTYCAFIAYCYLTGGQVQPRKWP